LRPKRKAMTNKDGGKGKKDLNEREWYVRMGHWAGSKLIGINLVAT